MVMNISSLTNVSLITTKKRPMLSIRPWTIVHQLSPPKWKIRKKPVSIHAVHLMYFISIPSFNLITSIVPEILNLPILPKRWLGDLDIGQRSSTMV